MLFNSSKEVTVCLKTRFKAMGATSRRNSGGHYTEFTRRLVPTELVVEVLEGWGFERYTDYVYTHAQTSARLDFYGVEHDLVHSVSIDLF